MIEAIEPISSTAIICRCESGCIAMDNSYLPSLTRLKPSLKIFHEENGLDDSVRNIQRMDIFFDFPF